MAGARIELDTAQVVAAIGRVVDAVENPAPLFEQITSYLIGVHRRRFSDQIAPDGTPWAPLSPSYQRRKHRNADKILTLRGHLQGSLRGQWSDGEYLFGTNLKYGAIHHYGGSINIPARSQQAYFNRNRDGSVGNRFVKRKSSTFSQWVTIGAHTIEIPARPWLGTSSTDDENIVQMSLEYLQFALAGRKAL